jgi:WD40 repeat protein
MTRPRFWMWQAWTRYVVFGASVMTLSCSAGSSGTAITPTSEHVPLLLWAVDGSEVYYLSEPTSLKAAKSDGSGVRVLDDTKAEYDSLFMSPDGSSLYYSAAETLGPTKSQQSDPHRAVYEAFHPHRIDGLLPDVSVGGILASPDDRHIAHLSDGGLQYFDLADGSSVELAPDLVAPQLATTLAFSPSGEKIFFLASDGTAAFTGGTVDLASKVVEPKSGPTGAQPFANWSDSGLRVLWSGRSGEAFQIEDVGSEQLAQLWLAPHGEGQFAAWSPDGTKVAVWDSWCVNWDWTGGCSGLQNDLYAVTIGSGAATRLVHDAGGGPGPVAFSPDGKRLAYSPGGGIYLVDVP